MTEPKDDNDKSRIEAGMELLRWKYTRTEWHLGGGYVHCETDRMGCLGSLVLMGSCIACFIGALVMTTRDIDRLPSFATIYLVGLGAPTAILVCYYLFRRLRPRRARSFSPPDSVLFTSNGVLVGPNARLWRTDDYRLQSVQYTQFRKVPILILDFGIGGKFALPVPHELEEDVKEMAEMLRAKTEPLQHDALPSSVPRPDKED